jgi:hypothetical protein
VTDDEIFTRLLYFGTVQMGFSDEQFWTMPFGLFMDLFACHRQFLGLEKPKREISIDDIIGPDI